jgi:hypothetical protein
MLLNCINWAVFHKLVCSSKNHVDISRGCILGRVYSKHEGEEEYEYIGFIWTSNREIYQDDLDVGRKIILKWILKRGGMG